MKLLHYIYILTFLLMVSACHKDEESKTDSVTPSPTPKILQEVVGDIVGYVYDEQGQPIIDAKVKIYNSTTKTDKYGIYRFNQVKLDQLGTYIKIDKDGFIAGSDFVYPKSGKIFSYTNLLAIDNAISFEAVEGGLFSIEGGGTIDFLPNSIVDDKSEIYSGTVKLTMKKVTGEDDRFDEKMPGGLRGVATNGNTVALATYGMLAVELRGENGIELNLKEGLPAKVVFSIPAKQLANAPSEIPLWYFDEDLGVWKEEGKAILVNGSYEGDLAHFSWWNYDAKFPVVRLCVNVFFDNGDPATNYSVGLTRIDSWTTYGVVDEDGSVCGLIPKGEVLTLVVHNRYCYEKIVEFEIGPFDNDVQLDDIIIPLPETLGNGAVTCNGDVPADAEIIFKYSTVEGVYTIVVPVSADGSFDLNFAPLTCDDILTAKIFAYSPSSQDASSPLSLNLNESNNDMLINICNNCSFDVVIEDNFLIECEVNSLYLKVNVTPVGDYTYSWDTGESVDSLNSPLVGTRCVTVTPINENCPVVKCIDIPYSQNLKLEFEIKQDPYCGYNNGLIYGIPIGGAHSYSYLVTGPNGFTSNDIVIEDLEEGTYHFIVTDTLGCTVEEDVTLVQGTGFTAEPYFYGECSEGSIYVQLDGINSNQNLSYEWSTGETSQQIYVTSPGNYCVTVSEGIGCESIGCVYVEMEPIVVELDSCFQNIYYFTNFSNPSLLIESLNNQNFEIGSGPFEYDVLKYDYIFTATAINDLECGSEEIHVPSYYGNFVTTGNNTSCSSCNDGSITIDIDGTGTCEDCEYGGVAIYMVGNLNDDLTSQNTAQTLEAGDYVVVVFDNNTNCFINHQFVTIE